MKRQTANSLGVWYVGPRVLASYWLNSLKSLLEAGKNREELGVREQRGKGQREGMQLGLEANSLKVAKTPHLSGSRP